MNFHVIFDVSMEDFRRKARLVAGEHVENPPSTTTYTIVVSRDTPIIALALNYLKYLPVKVAGIQNVYITAPVTEKIWTVLGREFGEDSDKKAVVVRAIYGLKSSGAAFRNHLADCMNHL